MSLSVDLTAEEMQRLAVHASRSGRSAAEYAHDAILVYLDELEAEANWAAGARSEWEAGGKSSRPLSDLRAELGL
jgi:predicted DNA-binding protein